MPSILFVCTGNTCRSPMAEAFFKARLKQAKSDLSLWRVESAGTWAPVGRPAAPEVIQVMAKRKINLKNHRSQRVNSQMLSQFELILTMESSHKEALTEEFPNAAARVFQLSEMAGRVINIADPIGNPTSEYEYTAQEIDHWIARGWKTILARFTPTT